MATRYFHGGESAWLAEATSRSTLMVRRWPWLVQVMVLFALTRTFSFVLFLVVADNQGVSPWGPASPGYLDFIGIWDSQWYERIYVSGYPEVIPRDSLGRAQENAWAFYPLFPFLVRLIHLGTGLPWQVLAPLVAIAAAGGAAAIIYLLFRQLAGPTTALWGVGFVGTFPVSPILQVPYAESLHLALLAAALLLVIQRHYLAAMPVVVLMCLARPAGVPFAVAIAVLWLYRRWNRQDPFRRREFWALASLTLVSGLAALAWPAIAWLVTGEITAYTDTETVWRGHGLTLFAPWFATGRELFGPVAGILAPIILTAAAIAYLFSTTVRGLGVEIRLWCLAYFSYLLAFLDPQTSTFRLLLPLFPLALAAVLLSRSRAYRGAVVTMFLLLQIVWVTWLWQWTELPGGGDYPP